MSLKQIFLSRGARTILWIYKHTISPFLGNNCRFHPPCSDYAALSIERHGLIKGIWLSLKRVSKCHPWCDGGFDYVPEVKSEHKYAR